MQNIKKLSFEEIQNDSRRSVVWQKPSGANRDPC